MFFVATVIITITGFLRSAMQIETNGNAPDENVLKICIGIYFYGAAPFALVQWINKNKLEATL